MPKPKQKAKPKYKPGLTQKQRFIEAAKAVEADATGEEFRRLFETIVEPAKPKPSS